MFERFTERARQVVVLAQEEARATFRHNYIGTEHILLGLLREEEGLAARVLESLDITVERVRPQVVRIVGPGEEVTSGQIPFTPRAKKVLELALREALSLGHNYIGTEHILLALVRENSGVAARVLHDFDVPADMVRNEVLRLLSGPGGRRTMAESRMPLAESPIRGPSDLITLLRQAGAEAAGAGRAPDDGDFLLALFSSKSEVIHLALSALGVDVPQARAAVRRARERLDQLEAVRRDLRAATEASDPDRAERLAAEERRLNDEPL